MVTRKAREGITLVETLGESEQAGGAGSVRKAAGRIGIGETFRVAPRREEERPKRPRK